jgi:hypothetical protein
MSTKKVDLSKREFIKGITSIYAAGNLMLLPGGHNLLTKKQTEVHAVSTLDPNSYTKNHYRLPSYAFGVAATGFLLNNVDYVYSIMIILIATAIFLFFGLPGIDYLPYSGIEQVVASY